MTQPTAKPSITFGLLTEWRFDGEVVNLMLDVENKPSTQASPRPQNGSAPPTNRAHELGRSNRGVTIISGRMIEGQRLPIVALLKEFMPELESPESIRNLAISKLNVQIRPQYGSYFFECSISDVWAIELDSGPTLAIRQLDFLLETVKQDLDQGAANGQTTPSTTPVALSQQRRFAFAGLFELFGGVFKVIVEHRFSQTSLADLNQQRSQNRVPSGSQGRTRSTAVNATRSSTTSLPPQEMWSYWSFTAEAENIDLKALIQSFGFSAQDLAGGLASLTLNKLEFNYTQARKNSPNASTSALDTEYRFLGKFDWNTGLELVAGGDPLKVQATVEIAKQTFKSGTGQSSALVGRVSGIVSTAVPLFESLQIEVAYRFTRATSQPGQPNDSQADANPLPANNTSLTTGSTRSTDAIEFRIILGKLFLQGSYYTAASVPRGTTPRNAQPEERWLVLTAGMLDAEGKPEDFTFGELLASVVSLFDPNFTDFQLDSPWDALGNRRIRPDQFKFTINLTTKTFAVTYDEPIDLILLKVSDLGLTYSGATTAKSGIKLSFNLSVAGQPSQQVAWDPINENPPAVPGETPPIFDLQFLAVGQRVSFAPEIVAEARTITQVMNVMRQTLVPLPPAQRRQNPITALQNALPPAPVSVDPTAPITFSGEPIIFNAESGILLGAQFSVLGTLDMSIIFNDPLIYGLRIALYGAKAKIFAGLKFEILYRRISDTVGVYHVELALPDAMRQLEFGAVSVTLPVVVVDIYTNGDFGIDFGFPWQGNFERSFAIQAFPFIGAGGFYFYKLSAATATSTPKITNGNFDPVLEFGIGLKIGLGKSFNKGVLRAELSISVHGILQGVIAWFNPTDPAVASDQYYKIQGGVSIVGRLYGVVDFSVITVEVEVIIRITVLFVVEAYQPIHLAVEAEVSVRASVKVVFVRIHFSFRLTVRQAFTLGSASPTPWKTGALPSGPGAMRTLSPSKQPQFVVPQPHVKRPMPQHSPIVGSRPTAANLGTPAPTAFTPPMGASPPASRFQGANREAATASAARAASWVPPNALLGRIGTGERSLIWQPIALELPALGMFTTQTTEVVNGVSTPRSNRTRRLIDLYFQVALTRAESSAQGVALLAIENFIPLEEDDPTVIGDHVQAIDTDFDGLTKALLAWAVYTYAPSSGGSQPDQVVLTLQSLEDLYQSVITYFRDRTAIAPFLSQLLAFLERNFTFQITDRPTDGRTDLSGSVFPMIPGLTLKVGDRVIDFAAQKRPPENLQVVRDYTRQLLVQHGSTVEPPLPTGQGALPSLSIAELIFADYFALLIRLTLQSAIDYLEEDIKANQLNPLGYTVTLAELLQDLNTASSFKHQAGTTSRFLLHGLRIPGAEVTATLEFSPALATEALYRATGQQFAPYSAGANPALQTVILQNAAALTWVNFLDYVPATTDTPATSRLSAAALVYDYYGYARETANPNQLVLVNQLNAATTAPITQKIRRAAQTAYYSDAVQRYSIRHQSLWQRVSSTDQHQQVMPLLEIPTDLRSRLHAYSQGVALTLKVNAGAQAGAQVTADRELAGIWSTQVRLTVSQVEQAEAEAPLPQTYQLIGTDEAGKALLDAILETGALPIIHLLYPASQATGSDRDGLLISHDSASVLALKTNLAIPDERSLYHFDMAANPQAFLKLILESTSLESGGYYLRYAVDDDGLPDALFNNGKEADLILLIQVEGWSDLAFPFHNRIAISAQSPDQLADLARDDVFIESPIFVKALNIPAGNLGFRVERPAIPINASNDTALDELENLYQLLSYHLAERVDSGFRGSAAGLPIGPAADDPNTTLDDDLWIYERVLPVYAFAKTEAAPPNGPAQLIQPPAEADPYRGIGATASVTLDFHWQDLYGNRLQATPAFTHAFPVRYFDELLGINQWPAVTESFTFTPKDGSDNEVHLNLELVFDASKYQSGAGTVASEVQKKISSDRALYEKIYYQIQRQDLTVAVQTSLMWKFHEVQASDTLQSVSTHYGVPVESLALSNQFVLDLFATGPAIQIPLTGTTTSATTVDAMARACLQVESLLTRQPDLATLTSDLRTLSELPRPNAAEVASRVRQLVSQSATVPHRLRHGTLIPPVPPASTEAEPAPASPPYPVKYGDTFAEVAQATGRSLEDLAAVLTSDAVASTVLAPHTRWTVLIPYPMQPGDSLDGLRQKIELVTQTLRRLQSSARDFFLSSDYLTVTSLAQQNATVALNPQMQSVGEKVGSTATPENHRTPLYIPDRKVLTDATFMTNFVERAYHYLATLERLEPYAITLSGPPQTLQALADRFYVSVGDLAETNQAVPGLFTNPVVIPVEWDVTAEDTLTAIATRLHRAERLLELADSPPEALLSEADNPSQISQKVQSLMALYQATPNLLTIGSEIPAKAASGQANYTVRLGDTLQTAAVAAGYALNAEGQLEAADIALLAAALQARPGLLEAALVMTVPLNYTPGHGETLEQMLQRVQRAAEHDYWSLLVDSLSVRAIGSQNAGVPLSAGVRLEIPHRLSLATATPGTPQAGTGVTKRVLQTAAGSSTAASEPVDIVSELGAANLPVTAADILIANQNIHGLLNPAAHLLPDNSPYKPLMQWLTDAIDRLPTEVLDRAVLADVQDLLAHPQPRPEETLGTLLTRFERLVQVLKLQLSAKQKQVQTWQGDVNEVIERSGAGATAIPPALAPILAEVRRISELSLGLPALLETQVQALTALPQPSLNDVRRALGILDRIHQAIAARLPQRFTPALLGTAIATIDDLFIENARLVLPPTPATTTLTFGDPETPIPDRYPQELITPVTVQVEMRRPAALIHDTVKDVPAVEAATAFLSPKVAPLSAAEADQTATLYDFALNFQAAFPSLKLATSGDRTSSPTPPGQPATQSLWAVKLSEQGITYNIHESLPFFFTAAPLANTLIGGKVLLYPNLSEWPFDLADPSEAEPKRFDAVDLNVLARQFLRAVEAFLKPEIAVRLATSANAASANPAEENNGTALQTVLTCKERLALAISQQVTHILALTSDDPNLLAERDRRQQVAAAALLRELRINLAEAYDIETIMQYNVDVTVATPQPWRRQTAQTVVPRLAGQPSVIKIQALEPEKDIVPPDFTLSPAKIALNDPGSNLTFFFNTKTPERFEENFELSLTYKVKDLEFDIDPEHAVSSWLSFILPLDGAAPSQDRYCLSHEILHQMQQAGLPTALADLFGTLLTEQVPERYWPSKADFITALRDKIDADQWQRYQWLILMHADVSAPSHIGAVQIPVPLREFPIAPSLIMQQAVADPDSVKRLEQVREWQYEFVYEHLNVAQDEIETRLQYNVTDVAASSQDQGIFEDPDSESLFDALVRFNQLYPQLQPTLLQLSRGEAPAEDAERATRAFSQLVTQVTQAWEGWDEIKAPPVRRDRDFVIAENRFNNTATITSDQPKPKDQFPSLELPEFIMTPQNLEGGSGLLSSQVYTLTQRPEGSVVEFFGESDIPDRKLTLPSLDIVQQQNAWAAIWLTRNTDLVSGIATNPAFVFQTPQIRFSDRLTPFLTNSKRWNVATLQAPHQAPLNRPLRNHIASLFRTVLPERCDRAYDIRIACQYVFALVLGDPGLEDDLLSSLPVFLSPRFAVPSTDGAEAPMSAVTAQLQENIAQEVQRWHLRKRPVQANGRFVFSLSIFSNASTDPSAATTDNPELPLLKIEHLSLALTDISEYLRPEQNIAMLKSLHSTPQRRTLGAHLEKLAMHLSETELTGTADAIQTVVSFVFEPESAETNADISALKQLALHPEAVVRDDAPVFQTPEQAADWKRRLVSQVQAWQNRHAEAATVAGQYVFSISLLSGALNPQTPPEEPLEVLRFGHFYLNQADISGAE